VKSCTQQGERGGEQGHGKCCYASGIVGKEGKPLQVDRVLRYSIRFLHCKSEKLSN